MATMVVIGIDTGGTFTDIVRVCPETGAVERALKVPSTPHEPAQAVLNALAGAGGAGAGAAAARVIHGTTVATNALLERDLARTALVTNRGFEDVLEIGRQARPRLHALHPVKPAPVVPRELRFGIDGRLGPDGREVRPPAAGELAALAARLQREGVEAIAVCLLHSWADGRHEREVASALADLGIPVTLSHEIHPEHREVERFSTCVVNAALVPRMRAYLGRVAEAVPALWVMRSDGGVGAAAQIAEEPVWTLLSGPAGGVVGAARAAEAAGIGAFLSIDVGGTSSDIALGGAPLAAGGEIAGLRVAHPSIDMVTIGAGGGSLGWRDAGGALRVGPRSAGADPGPACYGRGGVGATLTDACLLLGRLRPESFLGGDFAIVPGAARAALERLGRSLDLSAEATARGMLEVTLAATERALRRVSVERGEDPRERTLVAFGGAGGMIGADLARRLGMRGALIPRHPGLLSAWGMAGAPLGLRLVRSVMRPLDACGREALAAAFAGLEDDARRALLSEVPAARDIRMVREVDLRYRGQSHELRVAWARGRERERFEAEHDRRNGFRDPSRPVEVVCARLTALVEPPGQAAAPAAEPATLPAPPPRVDTAHGPVFDRDRLPPGTRLSGPATVCEYSSTTHVPADFGCRVLGSGALLLERGRPT
jgi:N-methylhydantoinase A